MKLSHSEMLERVIENGANVQILGGYMPAFEKDLNKVEIYISLGQGEKEHWTFMDEEWFGVIFNE